MNQKDFRVYKIDQEPDISYYIVKQRFLWIFWGTSGNAPLTDTYCETYARFATMKEADKAIERAIVMSTYPRSTRVS